MPEGAAVDQAARLQVEAVLANAPDWQTPEDESKRSQVFLVTLAAVLEATALQAEKALRTLEGITREIVRDAVRDAVANPCFQSARGGRPVVRAVEAEKLVVFLEEPPKHFHVALKLTHEMRFMPLKLALRRRSGFASHWSTTHTMWWSAVRRGAYDEAFVCERNKLHPQSESICKARGP